MLLSGGEKTTTGVSDLRLAKLKKNGTPNLQARTRCMTCQRGGRRPFIGYHMFAIYGERHNTNSTQVRRSSSWTSFSLELPSASAPF